MAETQIELTPKSANPPTTTYYPVAGTTIEWNIGKWRDLTADFDVRKGELPMWHRELSGTAPWAMIRRRYQVGPFLGEAFDSETLEEWTVEGLAERYGKAAKRIKEELDDAVQYWKRRREQIPVEERLLKKPDHEKPAAEPAENSEPASRVGLRAMGEIDQKEINSILEEAGFPPLPDADKRLYAARRIAELKRWFEDKKTRETARQIVFAELNLRRYEELLLKTIRPDEFRQLQAAQTTLAEKHQDMLTEIGADEEELDTQRSIALDSYSSFARGMQEWYAKNERTLIDGVFTADEVTWLLTPAELRPPQYRADIVTRLKEALLPENLWAENYQPTEVQRKACRALKRITAAVADEVYAEEEDDALPETPTEEPEAKAETKSEPETQPETRLPSFTRRIARDDEDSEDFMVTS